MKKYSFQLVIFAILVLLVSCIPVTKPMPTDLGAYKPLPFNKLINQAFASDVEGQFVKVDANFNFLYDDVGGAPSSYRDGNWVRIEIKKDDANTGDVMVPKSKSDILFTLKDGEPITIHARVVNWIDKRGNAKAALIVYQINRR